MSQPPAQLETLYQRHAPELLRFLARAVPSAADAEDLLQETFIEAVRFDDRISEAASPRAWLFGVARNVAAAFRRRLRTRRTVPLLHDLAAPAAASVDPRLEQVRRALQNLESPFRETLELRARDDLSYAEIADVLQVPVGTVRSRIHAAIRTLTEELCPQTDPSPTEPSP
jgi:RNA polymerase sigma-70 factor (ECF subfamily)